MQFLKTNQFIWNNQNQDYLWGDKASWYFQNFEILKRAALSKFEGILWYEDRTILVESELQWICLKRDQETDVLEIESSSDSAAEIEKFDLVSSTRDIEWIFIDENCRVVCSFENKTTHPIHQLKDALLRFGKQRLSLSEIYEKLNDLEICDSEEGGMKSYTYRGVVLE